MSMTNRDKQFRKTTILKILDLSGIVYKTTDHIGYQIRYGDLKIDFWPTVGKWRYAQWQIKARCWNDG